MPRKELHAQTIFTLQFAGVEFDVWRLCGVAASQLLPPRFCLPTFCSILREVARKFFSAVCVCVCVFRTAAVPQQIQWLCLNSGSASFKVYVPRFCEVSFASHVRGKSNGRAFAVLPGGFTTIFATLLRYRWSRYLNICNILDERVDSQIIRHL